MIVVRKRAGQDRGPARDPPRRGAQRRRARHGRGGARSRRTASSATCRRRSPTQPEALGEGLRLVRREWPTDLGPVDLMCRDADDGWVAVEIKRARHDRRGRAARALPRADPARPGEGGVPRHPRRAALQAAGGHAGRGARDRAASRSTSRSCAASASPTSRCSAREPGPRGLEIAGRRVGEQRRRRLRARPRA